MVRKKSTAKKKPTPKKKVCAKKIPVWAKTKEGKNFGTSGTGPRRK